MYDPLELYCLIITLYLLVILCLFLLSYHLTHVHSHLSNNVSYCDAISQNKMVYAFPFILVLYRVDKLFLTSICVPRSVTRDLLMKTLKSWYSMLSLQMKTLKSWYAL